MLGRRSKKRVVVLRDPVYTNSPLDELDVLVQAQGVSEALISLGYDVKILPFPLKIVPFRRAIEKLNPVCIFNLVETVEGDGRIIHIAPALFDHMGVPYTGAKTEAIFITSHKVLSKKWMAFSDVPTPEWVMHDQMSQGTIPFPAHFIIKPLWEDASVGIDKESVVMANSLEELRSLLEMRAQKINKVCFAERYIDGREFNLSLLAHKDGVDPLPPAEIRFGFPQGMFKIVDYKAKWDVNSFEYKKTNRSFNFDKSDNALLEKLRDISRSCWKVFDLTGYARVDFRVDKDGNPWVLEVNANPCINPDSGFVAATKKVGLSYAQAIERIVDDALARS
jgi:D-alanine-D-alanine ligase